MDHQQEYGNNFERAVISASEDIKSDRNKREYARYKWAISNMVGSSLLDIGCSSGFGYKVLQTINPECNYKGLDYDAKIIDYAISQFGLRFEQADINTYALGHRDTIIAFEVIEHLSNGKLLAQKLKDHCNELFISVPYNEEPGFWGPHHKLHRLTQSDFPEFDYVFMNGDGKLSNLPWDEPINLMLMHWSKYPKVSVIVTSHNYGTYLEECLTSIWKQTYKDYEIIVVDDGSSDNTLEIARRFDCAEIVALKANVGTTRANIEGIKVSHGQYICFINADDTLKDIYLEKCVNAIESNRDVAIAYTDSHQFGNGKNNDVYFSDFSLPILHKSNYILGSSLFRREAYVNVGGFDTSLVGMEDYDLWLNICENGWVGKRIPEPLYNYRSHSANRTNTMDVEACCKLVQSKYLGKAHYVTAEISTRGRYHTTLPLTLLSLAMQTRVPDEIIIFEDGEHLDIRDDPTYLHILKLFENKKILWKVIFSPGKGQHYNHQLANEWAKDLVWRLDDDVCPEPDVLEKLLSHMAPDVGCVGGTVLTNPLGATPPVCSNKIEDVLFAPNYQWFKYTFTEPIEVDHLHCSFLHRANVCKYNLNLSVVAHTEETQFTYEFRRKGFKVLFVPDAHTWHFRNPEGGIRIQRDPNLWAHDEQLFKNKLIEWGISLSNTKFIYLNNGLGDHLAFKHILSDLQAKYDRIVISCCYPEIFDNEPKVEIMSIAEANSMVGDGHRYNIYKWMWDNAWNSTLVEAYRKMYL